jgi:glycosyltransferase involved in cell wall biosynthesis
MLQPRIFFPLFSRYPSETAAAIYTAHACDAFARIGASVTIVVPRRFGRVYTEANDFYHLTSSVRVVYVPVIDLFYFPFFKALTFGISYVSFSLSALVYLLVRAPRDAIIDSNEPLVLWGASFFFRNCLLEVHDYPENHLWFYRMLMCRMRWILATNPWKETQIPRDFGVSPQSIIMETNGVSVDTFSSSTDRDAARVRLGLDGRAKIAVYTGHLFSWKGASLVAEVATLVSEVHFYFVGGSDSDVVRFHAMHGDHPNIHLVGRREHSEMPLWQKAADVLLLPNTARERISALYTSPMKMFEYACTGTPIIASDVPTIRALLNDTNSYLFKADDTDSFAGAIRQALADPYVRRRTEQAFRDVESHSWDKRAERILQPLSIETI